MQGTADTQVEPIHSSIAASGLWKTGRSVQLTLADGLEHAFTGGAPWQITRRQLLKFFDLSDRKPFVSNGNLSIAVNAGQMAGLRVGGFEYDGYFSGGFAYSYAGAATSNTDFPQLFDDVRAGSSFSYKIAVPDALYALTLDFAENKFNLTGARIFTVAAFSVPTLLDFDIYSLTGKSRRISRQIQLLTAKGQIGFSFASSKDNAILSSFEIAQIPY